MKNFKFLAVALSALLILSGCGNMNNATKGGLLGGGGGAALGALAGYLIGKDAKGAAIGAAVGGAVGTGAGVIIGKKMDKAKAAAEAVKNAQVEAIKDANGLQAVKVTFDSGILFATNKSDLNAAAKTSLQKFATDVLERFNNPYVDHQVTSIMLNSFPKYETRDLPGVKVYLQRKGELPQGLVFGLAAIITYYKGGTRADGAPIEPNDAPEIMQMLKDLWATGDTQKVAEGVLAAENIWHENLNNTVPGLTALVKKHLDLIQEKGMLEAVKTIL